MTIQRHVRSSWIWSIQNKCDPDDGNREQRKEQKKGIAQDNDIFWWTPIDKWKRKQRIIMTTTTTAQQHTNTHTRTQVTLQYFETHKEPFADFQLANHYFYTSLDLARHMRWKLCEMNPIKLFLYSIWYIYSLFILFILFHVCLFFLFFALLWIRAQRNTATVFCVYSQSACKMRDFHFEVTRPFLTFNVQLLFNISFNWFRLLQFS